jgi:hypothetical protein
MEKKGLNEGLNEDLNEDLNEGLSERKSSAKSTQVREEANIIFAKDRKSTFKDKLFLIKDGIFI